MTRQERHEIQGMLNFWNHEGYLNTHNQRGLMALGSDVTSPMFSHEFYS